MTVLAKETGGSKFNRHYGVIITPSATLAALSGILLSSSLGNKPIETLQIIAAFILVGAVIAFQLRKLVRLASERHTLRLGLDGELFVGEELGKLTHYGCWVFHDIPMEKGNIDHVVVGPSGVYTVETKYRSKPTSKNPSFDAQVIYDGKSLKFSSKTETNPIEQASLQAQWLSKHLCSATGKPVKVRPVVALPGWNVRRTEKSCAVLVISPKDPHFLARLNGNNALSEDQVKAIVHQLDQLCRDVEVSG